MAALHGVCCLSPLHDACCMVMLHGPTAQLAFQCFRPLVRGHGLDFLAWKAAHFGHIAVGDTVANVILDVNEMKNG